MAILTTSNFTQTTAIQSQFILSNLVALIDETIEAGVATGAEYDTDRVWARVEFDDRALTVWLEDDTFFLGYTCPEGEIFTVVLREDTSKTEFEMSGYDVYSINLDLIGDNVSYLEDLLTNSIFIYC